MAKKKKQKRKTIQPTLLIPVRWVQRWVWRFLLIVLFVVVTVVAGHRKLMPPRTYYMGQEARRLGGVKFQWVDLDDVAPVMARALVAAEDANFCAHWGFDVAAIRKAIDQGSKRGASTLTQQVVKNTYLWHGRSYARKAMEASITPLVELFWTKRRIVEVYLNIAEFDEGVFGIHAASQHYFGVTPDKLSPRQAARLAVVLPSPKKRSASKPTSRLRRRAASVMDGAATIGRDGRSDCFED
jgi:monofunctional biosynthetic peptidoglycan transglycosylase